MDISFKSKKLQRNCCEAKEMQKAYGAPMARKIQQRLMELRAAATLADMSHLPPARCHELENRGGVFSVDLVQPFRLLFEPADTPIPRKNDGGIDLAQVTAVQITAIEDTHDPKNQRRGQ